jgi:hypothetical protein
VDEWVSRLGEELIRYPLLSGKELGDLEGALEESAEQTGGEEAVGKKDYKAVIEFPVHISAMEKQTLEVAGEAAAGFFGMIGV